MDSKSGFYYKVEVIVMKKWEQFSDEELQNFILNSRSLQEVAAKVGYATTSGSGIAAIREMIKIKGFDSSHFLGQAWAKNNYDYSRFQANTSLHGDDSLPALINLRGRKCENCNLSMWQGQEIPLQVHHIDGNHYNNVLDNLQLLCPNCHAQTDTYTGRNKNKVVVSDDEFIKTLQESPSIFAAIKKLGMSSGKYAYDRAKKLIEENNIQLKTELKEINKCKNCGIPISRDAIYCNKCSHEDKRKTKWPEREVLKQLIRNTSFEALGRQYGVDGNTIRNWCDYYNLPRTKKQINTYSDDDWINV